jgi:hypothetical protein
VTVSQQSSANCRQRIDAARGPERGESSMHLRPPPLLFIRSSMHLYVWAIACACICEDVCREGRQEVRREEGTGTAGSRHDAVDMTARKCSAAVHAAAMRASAGAQPALFVIDAPPSRPPPVLRRLLQRPHERPPRVRSGRKGLDRPLRRPQRHPALV